MADQDHNAPTGRRPAPDRIDLSPENIREMLAKAIRLRGYLLHVEADAKGSTVAYLDRDRRKARGRGVRS